MTLHQALSLRRTMFRSFPKGMQRVQQFSRMGSDQGQRQVAALFEEAVVAYLSATTTSSADAIFLTESQILAEMRRGTRARGPTPDILFVRPVRINGHLVKWIDAKLYYGSATYANKKNLPNRKLQQIAQRYNNYFGGKGAFVFGQGFCADLSRTVTGAMLLDASPLDMAAVNDFQSAS